jgi:hypothetical protein
VPFLTSPKELAELRSYINLRLGRKGRSLEVVWVCSSTAPRKQCEDLSTDKTGKAQPLSVSMSPPKSRPDLSKRTSSSKDHFRSAAEKVGTSNFIQTI